MRRGECYSRKKTNPVKKKKTPSLKHYIMTELLLLRGRSRPTRVPSTPKKGYIYPDFGGWAVLYTAYGIPQAQASLLVIRLWYKVRALLLVVMQTVVCRSMCDYTVQTLGLNNLLLQPKRSTSDAATNL